jgi:hypothetical protein
MNQGISVTGGLVWAGIENRTDKNNNPYQSHEVILQMGDSARPKVMRATAALIADIASRRLVAGSVVAFVAELGEYDRCILAAVASADAGLKVS